MIMKKIRNTITAIGYCLLTLAMASCSDMLESDSTRQDFNPDMNEKTDSLFYSFGIFEAMQRLADQYVMLGEMRGDLLETTSYTDNNLRRLADFSATTENKYDSAYVYYRVINNCNYYLAYRDTTLTTNSRNVVINEYAAVKAIRAWAYLQLGRNYKKVPFYTQPLTQISDINDNHFPELTLSEMVAQLAPDLEQFSGYSVPDAGYPSSIISVGTPNWSNTQKYFSPKRCYIPVDVVLGDMYLEVGDYSNAALHFIKYLNEVSSELPGNMTATMRSKSVETEDGMPAEQLPDSKLVTSLNSWSQIFSTNSVSDIISYIPMASTKQYGYTIQLPLIFGADYYATPDEASGIKRSSGLPLISEIQVKPSSVLNTLSDSTEFYHYTWADASNVDYNTVAAAKVGDMRLRNIIDQQTVNSEQLQWITKYDNANVVLYRLSTVLLRLAEALNRLDMPDAAFGILKDGIGYGMYCAAIYSNSYITAETWLKLQTTYPLLSASTLANRYITTNGITVYSGIHGHGAGQATSNIRYEVKKIANENVIQLSYVPNRTTPYTFDRMVGLKMQEIQDTYGATVGATKRDTINAIEDMLCDEYALELAFEGSRYYDLMRLARHKNRDGLYGADFGNRWFAQKLAFKNPTVNLRNQNNWYLPFK